LIKFLKKDQNSNSANNEAFSYVNEYGSSRPKDHKENSSKNGKIRDIFLKIFKNFSNLEVFMIFLDQWP